MKNVLVVAAFVLWCWSCGKNSNQNEVFVKDFTGLSEAISSAVPGTEIVMANGEWENIQIQFIANGTEDRPITLRAETPGEVIIKGESDLKLGGQYLVVDGLYFTNGHAPSRSVIQFYINEDTLANHSRVTNCVIKDFNKPQKNQQDLWVLFKGRQNQLDHCYLAGKSNRGPTIRVDIEGNQSIKNHHKIINNHFGPRPPKGGPSAETIQLGNSSTSMSPSNTLVANNLFEKCNGEVEIISSKSNFNEFRNNVFYKSEGSLVTRHGNYCTVDGNYFIGDENSPHVGGIRLIGTGHWVTNNYFYNLKGEIFRAPLAVMNGIRRSAINRYIQVTDVVVAYNTWVDCKSPWQFGVGSNVDQKGVLPPSEIRSETPIRTLVANNVIYNSEGDEKPIVRHDSINGITFKSNIINNQGVPFEGVDGLEEMDFTVNQLQENFWVPSEEINSVDAYHGFEFDRISYDLLGNSRTATNSIGAVVAANSKNPDFMDLSQYGPDWFDPNPTEIEPTTHAVDNSEALMAAIEKAENGDIIQLTADSYELNTSLKINKKLTVQSADTIQKSTINYTGDLNTPAFEMNPKGHLILKSIQLKGSGNNYAFASLKENMSSLYNLVVMDSEISNFDYVLKAYKHSFSEYIKFKSTRILNCKNGIELSAEDDDRGEYNAENLYVIDCYFENVDANVIDYYRGGYDESTVGGNLIVKNSTFKNCGAAEKNGVLINTYGIINVDISDNEFTNNKVKLVARLWGAKNNTESNNTLQNSGQIVVEQNLPLKLMY
ncbi:MAG: alginate lyase [Muricauda sp.]|nr:chondroitinase-B domain-containing protein [Allomuricauda sp.]MBC31958.1 alginate lyase [Allomuricauda sp.]|tara:strand:+ start:86258 stop:88573 length:2316 start_codon:yes stop_codon:yes gene_type:complete